MASRIVILFALCSAACAQVPTGLNIAVDYRTAPELPIIFSWLAVPNATSYRIYETRNTRLNDAGCPAAPATPDNETTGTNYPDNPNPGWWKIPILDGNWKGRAWCYWVSAVVGGVESAKAGPVATTVGNAGYVFFGLRGPGTYSPSDVCAAGPILTLPSHNLADYEYTLYYAGADGVHHHFQVFALFEREVLGLIWHAPSVSADGDGFVIPWSNTGTYGYEIRINAGINKTVSGTWAPRVDRIHNYYTQYEADMLIDPGKADNGYLCADHGEYFPQENVITK